MPIAINPKSYTQYRLTTSGGILAPSYIPTETIKAFEPTYDDYKRVFQKSSLLDLLEYQNRQEQALIKQDADLEKALNEVIDKKQQQQLTGAILDLASLGIAFTGTSPIDDLIRQNMGLGAIPKNPTLGAYPNASYTVRGNKVILRIAPIEITRSWRKEFNKTFSRILKNTNQGGFIQIPNPTPVKPTIIKGNYQIKKERVKSNIAQISGTNINKIASSTNDSILEYPRFIRLHSELDIDEIPYRERKRNKLDFTEEIREIIKEVPIIKSTERKKEQLPLTKLPPVQPHKLPVPKGNPRVYEKLPPKLSGIIPSGVINQVKSLAKTIINNVSNVISRLSKLLSKLLSKRPPNQANLVKPTGGVIISQGLPSKNLLAWSQVTGTYFVKVKFEYKTYGENVPYSITYFTILLQGVNRIQLAVQSGDTGNRSGNIYLPPYIGTLTFYEGGTTFRTLQTGSLPAYSCRLYRSDPIDMVFRRVDYRANIESIAMQSEQAVINDPSTYSQNASPILKDSDIAKAIFPTSFPQIIRQIKANSPDQITINPTPNLLPKLWDKPNLFPNTIPDDDSLNLPDTLPNTVLDPDKIGNTKISSKYKVSNALDTSKKVRGGVPLPKNYQIKSPNKKPIINNDFIFSDLDVITKINFPDLIIYPINNQPIINNPIPNNINIDIKIVIDITSTIKKPGIEIDLGVNDVPNYIPANVTTNGNIVVVTPPPPVIQTNPPTSCEVMGGCITRALGGNFDSLQNNQNQQGINLQKKIDDNHTSALAKMDSVNGTIISSINAGNTALATAMGACCLALGNNIDDVKDNSVQVLDAIQSGNQALATAMGACCQELDNGIEEIRGKMGEQLMQGLAGALNALADNDIKQQQLVATISAMTGAILQTVNYNQFNNINNNVNNIINNINNINMSNADNAPVSSGDSKPIVIGSALPVIAPDVPISGSSGSPDPPSIDIPPLDGLFVDSRTGKIGF